MFAANQADVAGQDDVGLVGAGFATTVSRRDGIRDQRGRASTIKLSGFGSQPDRLKSRYRFPTKASTPSS